MDHAIKYMTSDRLRCTCTWAYNLEDRALWGTPKGNDKMLDAHSVHVFSMEGISKYEV